MQKILLATVIAISVFAVSQEVRAVTWTGKTISKIMESNGNGAIDNCFYFQLTGVTVVDPVVPANPWFAVPRTSNSAKDTLALLMEVEAQGITVEVDTNGSTSCGNAQAAYVILGG